MFIDTHSRESMEESLCKVFHMCPMELSSQLRGINNTLYYDDDYDRRLDAFITEHIVTYPDEILLFHFTRRLHGTENSKEGRNLADLLLTDNPFSLFLKSYNIEFVKGKQHIDVRYKGNIIDWDKCEKGNVNYMKLRLGYFKDREDFCFNGFAMKDLLYRNSYARTLSNVPEFLKELIKCLQCDIVEEKYMEISDYYCYEYKLPLSIVIFDCHENYSNELKQRYLLRCVLQRIHEYQTSSPKSMRDDGNPILRLAKDYIIPSEYYIGRERITDEMLV